MVASGPEHAGFSESLGIEFKITDIEAGTLEALIEKSFDQFLMAWSARRVENGINTAVFQSQARQRLG